MVDHHGERGVGLPLRRPQIWMAPVMLVLALGCALALGVGAWRTVTGAVDSPLRAGLGMVGIAGFTALFTAAAWALLRLRRRPGLIVVTPSGIVSQLGRMQRWEEIESVSAQQVTRQGSPRLVDIATAVLSGRQVRLFDAARLDTDPRAALIGLRQLHADPALRDQLVTDAGPAIFTGGAPR